MKNKMRSVFIIGGIAGVLILGGCTAFLIIRHMRKNACSSPDPDSAEYPEDQENPAKDNSSQWDVEVTYDEC